MSSQSAPEHYDEFALFEENAREASIAWRGAPLVRREAVQIDSHQVLSFLRWGASDPELVFLHGAGQNAHTWDTVLLALDRCAIAIDLPGHGHSSWRADRDYHPNTHAGAIEKVVEQHAPKALAIIGMSLGGLTALCLAAKRPDLVRKLVLVDVTPGIDASQPMSKEQRGAMALIDAAPTYENFDAMLAATMNASRGRSMSSVRRGVLHNARALPDGRWTWRYDRILDPRRHSYAALWDDAQRITAPTLLIRGGHSAFVSDADEQKLLKTVQGSRAIRIEGAGHSVQSDRPLDLVAELRNFV